MSGKSEKVTRSALQINLRCRACRFLKSLPAPVNSKPCHSAGIQEEARPCHLFKPSHKALRFDSDDKATKFVELVKGMGTSQLTMMAALLNQVSITRKHGFNLGDKVYILVMGGDYLSNYSNGYIVAADNEYVFVTGRHDNFSATLLHSSVMSEKNWQKKRAKLIAENRIHDPNYQNVWRANPIKEESTYEPPTIDDFLSSFDKEEKKVKKKNSLTPVDVLMKDDKPQLLRLKRG